MRFRGGGVGHKSTREATNHFRMDRDKRDVQGKNGPEEAVNRDTSTVDDEGDYGYAGEESDNNEHGIEGSAEEGGDLDTDSGYGDL
jgi:hypothetical protein